MNNQVISQIVEQMQNNLFAYKSLDIGHVPFPQESVTFWAYISALQSNRCQSGGYLEVGVEHGGTAFFAMASLPESTKFDLIDLQKTDRFTQKFAAMSELRRSNTTYHQMSSFSVNFDKLLKNKYQLIHIDGGHLYKHVVKDMVNFAPMVSHDTIMILDDVFETRWPGVTQAIFEYLPKLNLKPLFFVNRKLYVVSETSHDSYLSIARNTMDALGEFTEFRHWEVELLGSKMYTVKIDKYKSA